MSHYTAIVLIDTMVMLVMICGVRRDRFMPTYSRRRFQALFLLLVVTNLAEWGAAMLGNAGAQWHTLRTGIKCVELLLTPMVAPACIGALGGRHVFLWRYIPVAFNGLLQSVSLFTGWVFRISADNVYTRGPLYNLYMATFVAGELLLIAYCVRFSRRYQAENLLFLVLINGIAVAAMVMQLVWPYLRLDWTCICFATILFYVYYSQLIQRLDALTGLLNRRSYDSAMTQLRGEATLIFFDVDHFKEINDTYGHAAGDACLAAVGRELQAAFARVGSCYRYGGDEFCVIQRRDLDATDAMISRFIGRLRVLRKKDARTPYVSMGYTRYAPGQESMEQALRRADAMMYRYKQRHRLQQSGQGEETPT